MRKIAIVPAALACVASLAAPAAALASPGSALYDSTPVAGTVSVPSVGAEAYSFNQVGNEVILRPHTHNIKHVTVTMESWACQTGGWSTGDCKTTPGATFKAPITLHLYRYGRLDQATGAIVPGKQIGSVTRTFDIHYRPSSIGGGESRYLGSDNQLHNGIAQNIVFPVNMRLGSDVVWTVSYNTDTHGPHPLHGTDSPMDSLNVGLTPAASVGHDRFPNDIYWDTSYAGFTGGAPFVLGQLNLDRSTDAGVGVGYAPAVRFSTR